MKKFAIAFLIPLLLVMLASCDGDLQSKVAGLMDKLGGNVWIDSGLVEPNTAGVTQVTATVTNTSTMASNQAIASLGFSNLDGYSSPIGNDDPVLAPQSAEDKKALEDALSTALNSTTQTEKLKEELSKPVTDSDTVTAAQNSMKVAAAALTAAAGMTGLDSNTATALTNFASALNANASESSLTQGDVMLVQMMTNLVASTATVASSGDSIDPASDDVKAVIDDSLFLINVAQQVSGVGSLDLTQMLNLSDLMSKINTRSVARSGETESPVEVIQFGNDQAEVVGYVNQVSKIVATYVMATSDGTIDEAKYQQMIRSMRVVKAAYENAVAMASLSSSHSPSEKEQFGLTAMMDYAVATAFIELDTFEDSETFDDLVGTLEPGDTVREILQSLYQHTPKLLTGTLVPGDTLYIGGEYASALGSLDQEALLGKLKDYVKGCKTAILDAYDVIEDMATISDNTMITAQLTSDQLSSWFDSL